MTKCSECGIELDKEVNFCSNCGTEIEKEEEIDGGFCPNCGEEFYEGNKFCSSCGFSLKKDSIKVSRKSENIEKVTGVIPRMNTGWFNKDSYNIVVTNQRLIFTKISSDVMKQESEKALEEKQDSGFFSKWKASISSGLTFHERYYDMNPETIIEEDDDNYVIKPEEIEYVKLRNGNWDSDYGRNSSNEMELKWTNGKSNFNFDYMNPKQVKEILNSLLRKKIY